MGTPASDLEAVTQLSLELEGLRISITRTRAPGPASSEQPATPPPESSQTSPAVPLGFSPGSRVDRSGSLARSPAPASASVAAPPEPRSAIQASFREIPQYLLESARTLRSSVSSPEERARRAWTAGCWAAAVLEGRVQTPNCTPSLQLPSRVYVVLKTQSSNDVQVTTSRSCYLRLVDNHRGFSLSHGFPTDTEARIYIAGAGRSYPAVHSQ